MNLDAEIIYGYKVSSEQKKIWAVEIDLLLKLLQVCKKYNLKCFVAHGTLLGAVRHKGFIPWDDDIDVNMPRKDYEKLETVADAEFEEPYFLQTEYNDNWFNGFAKLRNINTTGMDLFDMGHGCCNGIFIDIFPMDGVFENKLMEKFQGSIIELFRNLCVAKIYYDIPVMWNNVNIKGILYKFISRFFTRKFLCDSFVRTCKWKDYADSRRVGIHSFQAEYEICYWFKEDFEVLDELPFENVMVPVPSNWHRCLQIKWGEYLKLPKIKDRRIRHYRTLFSADIPYKSYDISPFFSIFDGIEDNDFFLFGAGGQAIEFMQKYGDRYIPTAIFDNNKTNGVLCGYSIPIISANVIEKYAVSNPRIIITTWKFNEIIKQLKQLEFTNYKVYTHFYSGREAII